MSAPESGGERDDFLSGSSGTVAGLDGLRRGVEDLFVEGLELVAGQRWRLARAARGEPPQRRVLALGVERPEHRRLVQAIGAELSRSRHIVQQSFCPVGEQGKFENLNDLLAVERVMDYDWLLVVDDDVVLPRGFLDRALFLCERFSFDLAQPAHRLRSHAAWPVTRRQRGAVARETGFVEIGPVTLLARSTFTVLLPFPALRMGWGLDLHWAALARTHGWRLGVLDALAVSHTRAPAASAYSRAMAVQEARSFLAEHPYLRADEVHHSLSTHRNW